MMFKLLIVSLFLTSSAFASPVSFEPTQDAINTHLFGEPNPEWLNYVNDDGFFDPSLIEPGKQVTFNFTEGLRDYNAAKSVKFYLYTNEYPTKTEIQLESLESVKASTFNPKNPTRFLIHGWQDSEKTVRIQPTKDAYLKKGDFNVITVDWSKGSKNLNYYTCRHRVEDVAGVVRRFITFLVQDYDVKVSQLQVVGHSLGAHIAGLTGKHLYVGPLPVIVGLDPAGPLFSMKNEKGRLAKTDATYVEVMHTAAGSLGFDKPIGTADFYPNYGSSQPGCGIDLTGACAHNRACTFFAESIGTEDGFWSKQCGEYTEIKKKKCQPTSVICEMGGEPLVTSRAVGNYHLETNKKKPYAKGGLVDVE